MVAKLQFSALVLGAAVLLSFDVVTTAYGQSHQVPASQPEGPHFVVTSISFYGNEKVANSPYGSVQAIDCTRSDGNCSASATLTLVGMPPGPIPNLIQQSVPLFQTGIKVDHVRSIEDVKKKLPDQLHNLTDDAQKYLKNLQAAADRPIE